MTETFLSDTYKADSMIQLGTLKYITDHFDKKIDNMVDESALRGVSYESDTMNFFTTTDTDLTPAYNFNLPFSDVKNYIRSIQETSTGINFLDGNGSVVYSLNVL